MNPPSPPVVVDHHRLILEALENKDADEAGKLMRDHILDLRAIALNGLLE